MSIEKLLERRDELQGHRADFMADDSSDEREQQRNELHGAELKKILEALDVAGEAP